MTTTTGPTPDPQKVFDRIRTRFAQSTSPAPPVQTGSALAGDNAATAPLHLSHAAWFAWTLAVDQLDGVRALTEDARRIQPWAHHTLLRSALENAATALWLLAPDERDERVRRRLKLAGLDIHESARAQDLSGLTPAPPGRLPAERREEIKQLAAARGLDPNAVLGRFSYAKVLREAAPVTSFDPDTLELLWMTGSGIAHGRTWATYSFLDRQDVTAGGGDVRQFKITASAGQLGLIAATVLVLIDEGHWLYVQRRTRQH